MDLRLSDCGTKRPERNGRGENTTKKTAREIFVDIYGDADTEDKLTAIQEVLDGNQAEKVTKSDVVQVLTWLIEEYI